MADLRARSAAKTDGQRADADLLSSAVRRQIVEHLDALPRVAAEGRTRRDQGLTARELAAVLGLHVTTARFHLDQLLTAGLLDSHFVRLGGAGRPAKKYLVAQGDPGKVGTGAPAGDPYQVLATLLVASVPVAGTDGPSPEEAGVQWVRRRLAERGGAGPGPGGDDGGWRQRAGAVVDLLQEWGYTPELSGGEGESEILVTLRDCPFIELASTHPALVCGIHRGLLRGALEAAGESDAGVSLRPFTDERTCQAVLTRHGEGPDGLELAAAAPTPHTPQAAPAPDHQESPR